MKIDGRIAANKKRQKVTDEQILSDIAEGLTRQEIADRRGVHVENLARRMRKLGVRAKYAIPKRQEVEIANTWHYTEGAREFVEKHQDGFELVSFKRGRCRLRCKICGYEIERARSTIRQKKCLCDECERRKQEAIDLQNERIRLMRSFYAILELKKPKTCVCCGKGFFSQYSEQKFCSKKCKKKYAGNSIRHRCRKYGVYYDPSVTARKVFKRDGYICGICGLACDVHDKSWNGFIGAYSPTVDHIKALANGGTHTWDNVQCAHAICNSYKRDLLTV